MSKKAFYIVCVLSISIYGHSIAQMDLVLQTGNSGSVMKSEFHSSGKYLMTIDSRNSVVIWDLSLQKQYALIKLEDELLDGTFYNDSILIAATSRGVEFWDFTRNILVQVIDATSPCNQVVTNGKDIFYISAGLNKVQDWSLDFKTNPTKIDDITERIYISDLKKTLIKDYENQLTIEDMVSGNTIGTISANAIDVSVQDISKTIFVATKGASIASYTFDDKVKKKSERANNRIGRKYTSIAFTRDQIVAGNQNDVISVMDLSSKKVKINFKNKGFSIHSVAVNESGGLLAVGGENGLVNLYDMETYTHLVTLEGLSANVTAIMFSSDQSSVMLGYDNSEIKKWDFSTHQISTLSIDKTLSDKLLQREYVIRQLDEELVAQKYLSNRLFSKKEAFKFYNLHFDKNFSQVQIEKRKSDDDLIRIDKGSGTTANLPDLEGIKKVCAKVSPDGQYGLASTNDGMLYMYDSRFKAAQLRMFSPGSESFFYITNDNYYYASKSALSAVGVRYNSTLLGFEQIDLLYNRPDKVLRQLGNTSDEELGFLKSVYDKRLSKLNIDQSDLLRIDDFPDFKSNLNTLPINTDRDTHQIKVEASSHIADLKALHITSNGVPLYGKDGLGLSGSFQIKDVEIALTSGQNHIQIYVEDSKGLKSIREDYYMRLRKEIKPSLYVLSIGSGSFDDKTYDLKYAPKDAADVSTLFEGSKYFENTYTKTLLQDEVSLASIYDGIEWLNTATKDDVVMVFFAGHGMIDDSFDYYLSTSETDFEQPQMGSLLYDDFERLIGDLACRQKVLFVDACHSGEIDEEGLTFEKEEAGLTGQVVFRSVGKKVLSKSMKTFEMSKSIFVDLRQNSGVVVISAAGGAEYALESDKWSNGVFTYAMLNGLRNQKADLNKDKIVSLVELQKYVFKTVPKLTEGQQTPTSRVEILEQDFRVW